MAELLSEGQEMAELVSEAQEEQASSNVPVSEEEQKFDKEFWLKVRRRVKEFGLSWNRAMDEERAARLKKSHGSRALFVIIYKWPQLEKYTKKRELIPSLENLISRLTEIILDQDTNKEYEFYEVEEIASHPTLLHLAAEQNFVHVTRCLVEHYPGQMYQKTKEDVLPVELALHWKKDDTAAYLISQMRYGRVQDLFLCDEADEEALVKFYFGEIISYRNSKNEYAMKKTVLAVLNKLVNPRWPYLPDFRHEDESNDDIERAIASVPDDPINYDFHYHILEADENGRQPKIEVADGFDKNGEPINPELITNPKFNKRSVSCLRRIADSENKEAIQHPVVRMLVLRKWKNFAFMWFCIKACLFVMFLIVLSFALIYGATRDDPTQYKSSADKLRAFCEICSVVFLILHLFEEIGEMLREGHGYFNITINWHNYIDLLGIAITLLVLPLRFAESKSQWTFASLGYLFNFLRVFKYSNVSRTTALYTNTLVRIIQKDVTRFMVVFVVIFVGFCGALFMALKVDDLQDSFGHFGWLMLAGVRVLVEGSPVSEEYTPYGWLAILILLFYMGMVIVVLLNILIAQLSYTYSEAKKIAKLQYAADTMRLVTRLEYSRFECWNLKLRYYEPGAWISDEDLAEEILEYNEDRHPWESVQDRLASVREIMRKIIKKGQEKDPLEAVDEKLTHLTTVVEKLPGLLDGK